MKKRLSKLALLAVAAAFMVAGFPACSDDDEEEPTPVLKSIQVQTVPTTTAYTVGDTTPDYTGLVIREIYDIGDPHDVEFTEENKDDFTFTGFDTSKAGDVTVTVTYKEMTTTFTVSVVASGVDPTKTLASIAVKTAPTKTEYTVGDTTLEPAGLVITATYSDGSTEDIAYNTTEFTLTGFDSSEPNDSVTVTVTCKEMTATFIVSVKEKEKSLFETLSAQANNILKEDFATTSTVTKFGAGFGKVGVYGSDDGVTVADGAISTGAAGTIRSIYVDFGPVEEVVEGCVTLKIDTKSSQTEKDLLTFYNGDTAVLTLQTGSKAATATTASIGGTAGTYEIHYKFDLAAKTVSVKINDKAVLTDSALTADSVSGYTIKSHNKGEGTVTADDIAVCATAGDLGTYKAQVKAWLATLVANKYSDGYTMNKSAVDQAKTEGDNAIDGAADIDAVLAAYGSAKTALGNVKSDLEQAKANACAELDAYFPENKSESDYTDDKLAAVNAAKEAGKTAINAATSVDAVNAALAEAKEAVDELPDDNAQLYTVTVKDGDDNGVATVPDVYKNVKTVLDEIKKQAADKNKVIVNNKFYSDQACTAEYDIKTDLTGDVTVYVKVEEKKSIEPITVFDGSTMSKLDDMPASVTRIDTNTKQVVDSNKKTLNNKNFTSRFKFGGTDTDSHSANALKIATGTTSAVKVVVYAMSSSSGKTGYLKAVGSGAVVDLFENGGSDLKASEEISVTPDAEGNIYIYAATQAMNVYYLYISQ